jgi:hypothetical protein
LLSLSAESDAFQFATQKYKDYDIRDYNFASCFVWVLKLVSNIDRVMLAEGIQELGAEEDI